MGNLTLKQRLFVENYIKSGGNATRAYTETYGQRNDNIAAVCGHRMIRLAKIRAFLDSILAQAGISNEALARSLKRKIDMGNFKSLELAFKLSGYKID